MAETSSSPSLYLGSYAVCRDPSGRLLLAHIVTGLDAGRWALPGGGVEWGEHPDAAVLRELREEAGLCGIMGTHLAGTFSCTYERTEDRPFDPVHHVAIIYDVGLRSFDLTAEENGSTDRCEWFDEDQARQLALTPLGRFGVDLAWSR